MGSVENSRRITVASDIGGTFTDTVVLDESDVVRRFKAPTTPTNLVEGVLETFDLASAELGLTRDEFVASIETFSHGTTVATNALLERRGARTGVLLTEGFGDSPTIMRGMKGFGLPEETLKDWRRLTKKYSVVDRRFVREVPERVDYAGRVIRPLDEDRTREIIRDLLEEGIEALAICLLWCVEHPDHERRVAEIAREESPDLYVSVSSEILPRLGEYARMITTATNSFLGPEVSRVTTSLDETLRSSGLNHEALLMQSNGGLVSVAEAAVRPVSFLLSGPVGGVVGSRLTGNALDEENVITADMGGTSFDVGLIVGGRPLLAPTTHMDNQPIAVPSVAVETVGAGGGSIANVEGNSLSVGPASAGAVPGPACYGRGGTEPTVTDADVVLGLVNPTTFLGGRTNLDRDAAEVAIREKVADPLGITVEDAAEGIKRIVDAKMADLIRQTTVHRGHDPRNFVLVAFGGAGPVHAHAFGADLGVGEIVIPPTASVHSAMGIAASELVVTHELTRAFFTPAGSTGASEFVSVDEVNEVVEQLGRDSVESLERQGLSGERIKIEYFADMRFRSQIHELTIQIDQAPMDGAALDRMVDRFIETYEARFGEGSAFTAAGVELVNWRAVATGLNANPVTLTEPEMASSGAAATRTDQVYFGGWQEASVYVEDQLAPGLSVSGPAIFELSDTNIVVGPGQQANVDRYGNVAIRTGSRDRSTDNSGKEMQRA